MWGAITVLGSGAPLPASAEARLRALAEEQAALRRVAELVARGAVLEEVFAAVANEASNLLGRTATALLRYDSDDLAVTVAACNSPAPLGLRIPSGTDTPTGEVLRTGRAARVDSFAGTALSDLAKDLGVERELPCRYRSKAASGEH